MLQKNTQWRRSEEEELAFEESKKLITSSNLLVHFDLSLPLILLAELHKGHQGVNRMKSLARMYFWWPGLTKDIEKLVIECAKCQENQSNPAMAPLEPWTWPTRPWASMHVDYVGPFMNSIFL